MRPVFWLMLTLSVVANVYVNTFSGWEGAQQVVGSSGTGVVVLGSAVGLWLTRPRTEN
ncbi:MULTISPECIES: hypothetical protein [unclassified Streptomyces]|uniref:hypothetical protein n=1 Tax=unclassified Streptomyces TaxID=2593676 RepID=UPI0016617364|nr:MULTISPECIES: hypothetical protein [unclassified Streptomyces]